MYIFIYMYIYIYVYIYIYYMKCADRFRACFPAAHKPVDGDAGNGGVEPRDAPIYNII